MIFQLIDRLLWETDEIFSSKQNRGRRIQRRERMDKNEVPPVPGITNGGDRRNREAGSHLVTRFAQTPTQILFNRGKYQIAESGPRVRHVILQKRRKKLGSPQPSTPR